MLIKSYDILTLSTDLLKKLQEIRQVDRGEIAGGWVSRLLCSFVPTPLDAAPANIMPHIFPAAQPVTK
jgi:hypothetical protein